MAELHPITSGSLQEAGVILFSQMRDSRPRPLLAYGGHPAEPGMGLMANPTLPSLMIYLFFKRPGIKEPRVRRHGFESQPDQIVDGK